MMGYASAIERSIRYTLLKIPCLRTGMKRFMSYDTFKFYAETCKFQCCI